MILFLLDWDRQQISLSNQITLEVGSHLKCCPCRASALTARVVVGESLRHNTPNEMQCSMFCGGRRCKYESSSAWKAKDLALEGIFSHWITEDLLAMARPNTAQIESHRLIAQFNRSSLPSLCIIDC